MIMHADTYNAVLRQHHYRQKQLSTATGLLSQLPLFKSFAYSQVAAIAYTMTSQTYSSQSTIAKFEEEIKFVSLIVKGEVKTFAAPVSPLLLSRDEEVGKVLQKRIPKLAVAFLGRGQIIGESEVHHGFTRFQHTYVAVASATEVLQIPIEVYKENVADEADKEVLSSVRQVHQQTERVREDRLGRAREVIKGMVGSTDVREVKSKRELMNLLPVILDAQVPQGMPPVAVTRRPLPPPMSTSSIASTSTLIADEPPQLRLGSIMRGYESTGTVAPSLSLSPRVSPRLKGETAVSPRSGKEDAVSMPVSTEKALLASKMKSHALKPPTMLTSPPPSFRTPRKLVTY